MINSESVTFHILWKAPSLQFSFDQQQVSDIALFVNSSLITSFLLTNSKWVTLHILWQQSCYIFLWWQIASEWHACFVPAVSSHLFLWPTASEWLPKLFDLHSQHTLIYKCLIYNYILFIHTYQKVSICHIFSRSSFHIIIIIDCKISFQLTHSLLIWSFLTYITFPDFQVSGAASCGILYLIASVNFSPCLETSNGTLQSRYFVLSFWVHNWCHCNKLTDCQVLVCKLCLFIYSI